MTKMKRMVALLLALVMVLSLAACGEEKTPTPTGVPGSTGTPTQGAKPEQNQPEKKNETVTLTVYSQLANYSGEQVGWFAKIMLDKFNVKLNIIPDADGRFATLMESGNLGDIVVFGNDTDDYQDAVKAGMLYDWNEDDLVSEYGSYIKENFSIALDKNISLNADGKLYGFGHSVATNTQDHQAFFYYPDVRFDLYQQIGTPAIKTLEDYVDVLGQMVAVCPTSDTGSQTYGVSMFPDWDGDMVMYVKSTGALYGYDEFGFGLYDVNNQVYDPCIKEGSMYLRCLKFYNDLYQKKLLNPDSMTQTYNDCVEDYQTGAAFFTMFNFLGSSSYNTEAHMQAGKAMLALPAEDFKNIVYGLKTYGGNRVWCIGSKTQYPELCMEIINWLSTPDGRMTLEYGPKGVTWDYNAEGAPYLTELGVLCKQDKEQLMEGDYAGTKYGDGTFQINNTTWDIDAVNPEAKDGSTFNYLMWNTYLARDRKPIQVAWSEFTGYVSADEYLENNGHISVSIGTPYTTRTRTPELKVIWEQIADVIKNYSWQAIYAKSDAEFNFIVKEMRTKCEAYGYAECLAFYEEETEIRKQLENEEKAKNAGK